MDSDRSNIPKISLPVQAGSLGSRAALELVRNSRLRSSCPPSTLPPPLSAEPTVRPLTVASFMAMKNGNRSPKPRRTGISPQPGIKHKKAVIPITSRQTSRVLNNLNLDCVAADVQLDEGHHDSLPRRKSQEGEESHVFSPHHGDVDTLSTDSGSSDTVPNEMNQSGTHNPSYKQWGNQRNLKNSNRNSVSSFGSSEEDLWISKGKS